MRDTIKKKSPENKDEVLLKESEVWDIINFARGLSGGVYPGVFTPDLINARMKDVTLNPMAATEETLSAALLDPKNNESTLQAFSENFELQSQPYKRLISYLGSMLSFDMTYHAKDAEFEDYKSPKYKKDLRILSEFLDGFDYQQEFSIAVRQMLRNEAYFCCPRMDGEKLILQELPSTYCKITGRWDYGLLFSFNMYWFLLPGVDINMYPLFFKKKYKEIFVDSNGQYRPSLPPEARGSSSWVYWVDVPVTVGWAFKMTPEMAARVPYFSPLFNDLVLQPLVRNLQKNINMSTASRIIVGEVPMLNKDVKAAVRDSIAISPDLLGKFLALVRQALSESIKVASAPLQNMQGISFDSDNEVYDAYLKTALASSGINSNLIFSSNIKPNAIETQLSLNVDEQLMYTLYPQFAQFMEYHINKLTRNYKFSFQFEGTKFFTNRAERFERTMTLADKGIVLPQKIAAAIGMRPDPFIAQMQESKAMSFTEMLTPIIPAFQISKDEGRPKKSIEKLGDGGLQTRGTESNQGRGGKISG